ncbi:MAG: GLPGLI family protein [Bacteroidota bacterium]
MRKLSVSILFIILHNITQAQVDSAFASVRYTFTHIDDTTQPENPHKENMVLYLGKELSLYVNYDKMMRIANGGTTSAGSSGGGGMMVVSGGRLGGPPPAPLPASAAAAGNYYKEINGSKTFSLEFAGGKVFSVEDKTPAIDWTITEETKDLMGVECQKATGNFKGRTYTAWFSTQLPFSNGPWKLGGLPGLILEAYDAKKEVMFKLVTYENAAGTKTAIEIPKDVLKTTPMEMKQFKDALQRDREAAMGANGGGAMGSLRITSVNVSANGTAPKLKKFNNPIEIVQ